MDDRLRLAAQFLSGILANPTLVYRDEDESIPAFKDDHLIKKALEIADAFIREDDAREKWSATL